MEVLFGSLLTATFDMLFKKLDGYLSELRNIKEEARAQMENWKTLLPKITTILQHAEENPIANQFVKSCLDDLRDLAYDMEDIIEEFAIDAKRFKLITELKASTSKAQKVKSSLKNLFRSKAKHNQEIIPMVNQLNVRLQRIEREMHTLALINLIMKAEDKSHKVTTERLLESALLKDKVWGRESDTDAIIQRLLEDGGSLEEDFVIPIVGMGGLGKTTLARLIYNDKRLESKFVLKAWVCVSDEFDIPRITRNILEHVTEEKYDFENFTLLQEKLESKLSGHRFFLVLDDVWNEQYEQWNVLKKPLMSGALGSKIIVTTRSKEVGKIMGRDNGIYCLKLLEDDACLSLFTQHALGAENFDGHPHLKYAGEELVRRCKGLPLAVKTLGGLLHGKPHRVEWDCILNNKIWHIAGARTKIAPALRLSYNHLPSHLKQCFAYCALFPKDYEFDEKKLVLLWMAEGLLQQQSHGKKQMEEDIGHQYFQELLSRSFFQQSSKDESRFVMHDLINDLAIDVAGEIYCNLAHSMGDEKLEKVRRLSFIPHHSEISKRFMVLDKLKHLRTFFPLEETNYEGDFLLSKINLHDFPSTLIRLRVLSLCSCQISKLPDSFENLKHIRYIDLSGTKIKYLPKSVGSLLLLQTLLLCGCHQLTTVPATIGNLIDLLYLDINDTPSLKEMPLTIGNLKNLLTLSKVIVGKASGLMRLSNLKNLLQLRGKLSILDLQNVSKDQDAEEVNIDKIHGLEELVLEWTTHNNDQDQLVLQRQVLDWLKPHSNLKSLKISCYGGDSFSSWVEDPSLLFNLSSLELSNCRRCTSLPSLGRLPVLKKLIIEGMEAIENVGFPFYGKPGCFPLLEVLEFENMLNWKKWTLIGCEFPCLCRVVIKSCPNLGQLPYNLSSLKELDIRRCNAMLLESMDDLTSLSNLRIEEIAGLNCLPKSFTKSFTTLETLYIGQCNDLTFLWEEGVEIEQSLLPFNLKDLSLVRCGALESLPNAMMRMMHGSSSSNTSMFMSRLEKLKIWGCDSLKSFPRGKLPTSLKHLRIKNCKGLESLLDADGDNNSSNLHWERRNVPCLNSSKDCRHLPAFLEKITVADGGKPLESFPERMLQHYTVLQFIEIDNCKILKSLPNLDRVSNLVELYIYTCEALEPLPEELGSCTLNLRMRIVECENFQSFPVMMCQLKSLQKLWMIGCPNIKVIPKKGLPPNLIDLQLIRCKNLNRVSKTMYQLTSLQSLRIPGGALRIELQNLTSLQDLTIEQEFPQNIVLPSSLTSLQIWNEENLKSIPKGLFQNLNSLKELNIIDCPKLQSLPRENFPPSLGELYISGCPLLRRQQFEPKGDYPTLTHSIPRIKINVFEVNP